MANDPSSKITRSRSPRAPSESLERSLDRIEQAYGEIGRSLVPANAIANAIGFKTLSGPSRTALAGLSYYGLLERQGNNHKISELAMRIIRPLSPEDKAEAIEQASREPRVFDQIFAEHSDCSESTLASVLLRKDFTEDSAKRVAKIFRDNLEFVSKFGEDSSADEAHGKPSPAQVIPISHEKTMTSDVATSELPVPIGENRVARVPFPMTEEDFDLFVGTLQLWKKKLVKKPDSEETD